MGISKPGSLAVSLLEVEEQNFDPSEYTFKAVYKLKLHNNNLLLRKRIKYPSFCIRRNGKMLECPLTDMDGNNIEVLTIPAKKSETIEIRIEESNPPFTDIGEFSYDFTYYLQGSKTPIKAHILPSH